MDPISAEPAAAAVRPLAVTLRYWAAIRTEAGTAEERFAAGTLADLLAAARERHGASSRFAQVLGICSFLVGEVPVGGRDHRLVVLEEGSVIEALPPFAGG